MKRPVLSLFPVALLGALACAPGGAEAPTAQAAAGAVATTTAMRVEVATLAPTVAAVEVALPGEIKGARDARLATALGGFVEALPVKAGQRVGSGALIARVDAAIYEAQRDQAQAQLDQARIERARLDKLGDLATDQQKVAGDTQVRLAEASLKIAQTQVDRASVKAPFSGVIADTFIEAGEFAGPGSLVARLVQTDKVIVSLSVPDRDVVALEEGMPVAVTANARAGIFHGTLSHIAPAADLNTRTFIVEVEVPNPDGELLPGMIARVVARRELAGEALMVPQDWIVTRLSDQGVFVDDGGVARFRPVTLGQVVRDQIVITDGVKAGERVVITGHRDLVDGDKLLVAREGTCCTSGRATF